MSKQMKPVFSDDVIALARDELKHAQRGDKFLCAIMRSHGKDYVLARAGCDSSKRGSLFAIDESGKIYPTLLLDGLYSVRDEPDVYHCED